MKTGYFQHYFQHYLRAWQSSAPHPESRWQRWWLLLQGAIALLPFSPLLACVGASLAAIAVWWQRWPTLVRRPVNQGLSIVAVWMILSTIVARQPVEAALGLFNFLPLFFVFAGLSELLRTPAQLRRLAWILVLSSVPVAIVGLGQLGLGWQGPIQILWIVVDWPIEPNGDPPGRMSSIFSYATVLASYFAVTFTIALGLWIDAIRTPSVTMPSVTMQRVFLGSAVFLNAIALILTDSRNVWAIALISGLAYALYVGWRWLVAGVWAIALTVLGAAFAPNPLRDGLRGIVPRFFWARLTDELYPDRPIAQLRSTQWQFAFSMVQQRPLTGWGLRNFSAMYYEQTQLLLGHPHNLYLMLAAETGLPATIAFIGLVGWVMYRCARCFVVPTLQADSTEALMVFTVWLAFITCILFGLLDITLFDIRINLLGWIVLAALNGVTLEWIVGDRD